MINSIVKANFAATSNRPEVVLIGEFTRRSIKTFDKDLIIEELSLARTQKKNSTL